MNKLQREAAEAAALWAMAATDEEKAREAEARAVSLTEFRVKTAIEAKAKAVRAWEALLAAEEAEKAEKAKAAEATVRCIKRSERLE